MRQIHDSFGWITFLCKEPQINQQLLITHPQLGNLYHRPKIKKYMTKFHQLFLRAVPEMKRIVLIEGSCTLNQITNWTSQHTVSVVSLITSSSLWECNCRTITPLSNTLRRTGSFRESSCLQAFTKSSGDSNYNKWTVCSIPVCSDNFLLKKFSIIRSVHNKR